MERGAKVDEQNESLKTALMLAAFYGRLQLVKILRQYGACYNKRDNSGMAAIHYAIDGGNCDTIEYMVMDGANINEIDTVNGWTPLLRAASLNAKADVARVLIKYGADMNISDVNQKTALMVATINGNLPFVQVLVSHGADMTKLNEYGKSLYELALAMDRKVSYFETILDFVNIFGLIIFTFFAIF
jgi:ankyrin repeat protein